MARTALIVEVLVSWSCSGGRTVRDRSARSAVTRATSAGRAISAKISFVSVSCAGSKTNFQVSGVSARFGLGGVSVRWVFQKAVWSGVAWPRFTSTAAVHHCASMSPSSSRSA